MTVISLYVSAARPGYVDHALAASGVDAVVLDLEDSVAGRDKDAARDVAAELMRSCGGLPDRLVVRVNAPGSAVLDADLSELVPLGLIRLRLPRVCNRAELEAVLERVEALGCGSAGAVQVELMIETVPALRDLEELVTGRPEIRALTFGGEDFLRDSLSRGVECDLWSAKRELVEKAAAVRLPVYDTVYAELHDRDAVWEDAHRAARLGFAGKSIIHPAQSPVTRDAFGAARR
ncbi:HpcH/HpaI aldolase/citrate lyase family protein [Streptomyces sp. NPDC005931]|uniref:HpcH/HpaI aldolase/citrate lyase family protein n=1 Tax=Streptomyces sp. NPDC005931 TaxID=3364737 RepID=UPI0036D0B0E0